MVGHSRPGRPRPAAGIRIRPRAGPRDGRGPGGGRLARLRRAGAGGQGRRPAGGLRCGGLNWPRRPGCGGSSSWRPSTPSGRCWCAWLLPPPSSSIPGRDTMPGGRDGRRAGPPGREGGPRAVGRTPERLAQAGRYDLLAGEAQLEALAATAVRRSGAAALAGWIPVARNRRGRRAARGLAALDAPVPGGVALRRRRGAAGDGYFARISRSAAANLSDSACGRCQRLRPKIRPVAPASMDWRALSSIASPPPAPRPRPAAGSG